MELLTFLNENPVMPFIGIAFCISIILIFITKHTENPPPIVIPADLNLHTLIAFLIKISLERPKGLSILTLVVLFMVIATGTALSAYSNYIQDTQDVSGNLIKQVEQLATNQVALTENVKTLSVNIENRNNQTHPRLLSKLVNENIDLGNMLETFRRDIHASRVSVLEFHNGSQTFSGMPFGKVSTTHEATAYGIPPEINNLQNVPIREFITILPNLINNTMDIYVHDNAEFSVGFLLDDLLTTRNTKTAIFVPFFMPNVHEPVGLILIEWDTEIDTNEQFQLNIKKEVDITIKRRLVDLVRDINTPISTNK